MRECSSHTMCHVSRVTYHVSPVNCHLSPVTCCLSCVTCHLSHVKIYFSYQKNYIYLYFLKLDKVVGGGSVIIGAFLFSFIKLAPWPIHSISCNVRVFLYECMYVCMWSPRLAIFFSQSPSLPPPPLK